jgi:nucleolar GTP-binding protein
MDGKNIADFVDPDILKRLEELEEEERLLEENDDNEMDEEDN